MTVREVAQLLRVSESTVRGWRAGGKIKMIQLPGGTLRIPKEEVERLVGGTLAEAALLA